ncbi:hypothetical protein [uncultured Paracoccus sp.]|uniref:hypothetical protein n=1 Tax=uncultured Paracoccus sp. TaxID=189685 RepID=UPI0026072EB3|nr:hypothetical protein [uncultured Paracoccus sp.]
MKSVVLAMGLVAGPIAAHAQQVDSIGYGMTRCGEVTEVFHEDPLAATGAFSWAAGYATAMNASSMLANGALKNFEGMLTTEDSLTDNGFINPILEICEGAPDMKFWQATTLFLGQLPWETWPATGKD